MIKINKYRSIEYPNPDYGITLGCDVFDDILRELN
jgi:hypothetical protein